jgi:hypothetical protein
MYHYLYPITRYSDVTSTFTTDVPLVTESDVMAFYQREISPSDERSIISFYQSPSFSDPFNYIRDNLIHRNQALGKCKYFELMGDCQFYEGLDDQGNNTYAVMLGS